MIDHLRRFSGTLDGSTRHAYPPPKSIARARHRKARRGRSPARSGVSVSHFVSVGDGTKLCTANSVMGFPLKDSWRVNTDAEFLIGPQDAPYVQRFRNLRSRVGPRRVGRSRTVPDTETCGHVDVRWYGLRETTTLRGKLLLARLQTAICSTELTIRLYIWTSARVPPLTWLLWLTRTSGHTWLTWAVRLICRRPAHVATHVAHLGWAAHAAARIETY